jgi:hypothetical protein
MAPQFIFQHERFMTYLFLVYSRIRTSRACGLSVATNDRRAKWKPILSIPVVTTCRTICLKVLRRLPSFNRRRVYHNVETGRLPVFRLGNPSQHQWMFTTDKARAKLGRAYPATAKDSKSL